MTKTKASTVTPAILLPVGTRVRVAIPTHKRDGWAMGAADALDGMTGVIACAGSFSDPDASFVAFDRPAPTWWTNQTPPIAFWFDADEIVAEAPEVVA